MRDILIILSLMILISCSSNSKENNEQSESTSVNGQNKANSEDNTEIISEKMVVFLFPDSLEIEKMKQENGEEAYNEVVADMTWYPAIAAEVLDSLGVKNIYCSKEFLLFKKSNNQNIKMKRKEIDGDMIVFNPDKELFISSSVGFDKKTVLEHLKE